MVRYLILSTLLLIIPHVISGQALSNGVQGKTIESTTRDPLQFVIIILRQLPDSNLITSTSSDEKGMFGFTNIPPGQYFIETNLLGFRKTKISPFEIQHEDQINLGELSLVVDDVILDQIEISAINPALVNAIDRKIYYPENDIQGQSGSATDILQNIPSIAVGPEGEVLMRGSGNIQFLLNGKRSALLNANSATILEQIPAHTIERIEIITNPSAKYKPDGVAGLINIITKKNTLPGFNGNVLANASTQGRYNGNISLNYNPGKFNISGLYGYWQNYSPRTYKDSRIVRDSFSEEETKFDLLNETISEPRSHTATLALDYQPNEKNSFSLSSSYFDMKAQRHGESTILESNSMGIINDYITIRSEVDAESELELSMNGEHTFKKEDHSLSFEAAYTNFDEEDNSYFTDIFEVPTYPPYEGHNIIGGSGQITSLSADYSNPLSETLLFEAGFEGEYSSGELDNYAEYFDPDDMTWIIDAGKTNTYLYTQDINAAYATLSKNINALGILAGLRAEQTNIESNLINYDSIIPNNYFNLFPTLHLSYELSESEEFGLSYSRRVNRPDPDELNPFPEYENIRDIEAGNPYLKPEQVHSIELGYHLQKDHFSFLPTIYYRQTFDGFAEEVRYINDSTLLTTQVNLAREQSGGLEFIFTWTPDNNLNFNFNTNVFYNTIDASNLGYEDDKSIVSADMKLGAFYNILSSTKIQFNATYRSAMLSSQGRSLPVAFLNAGIKQDLFKKKASLTLTISDIFNSQRWRYIIDTPLLYQEVERKRKSQIVYLGFSYRFGLSPKKNGEELIFDDRM